jgi:hypothetical protein
MKHENPDIATLPVGARVFVCDRYLGNWSSGFEIAEVLDEGYRLCRLSDRRIFPDIFTFDEVQSERREDPLRGVRSHLDRHLR